MGVALQKEPESAGDTKKCQFCAETILSAAVVCKHCQRDVQSMPVRIEAVPTPATPAPKKRSLFSRLVRLTFGTFGFLFVVGLCTTMMKGPKTADDDALKKFAPSASAPGGDVAAGNVEKTKPAPVAVAVPNDTEKQAPPSTDFKIGDTVSVGYMVYGVWKTRWTNQLSDNQYLNKAPNAKFLFVEVTARNDDKKARSIPQFKLIDENGAEYDTTSDAMFLDNMISFTDELNPSVSKQGYVVFDVPPGRKYKLVLSGGYWSSDTAVVDLSATPSGSKKKK